MKTLQLDYSYRGETYEANINKVVELLRVNNMVVELPDSGYISSIEVDGLRLYVKQTIDNFIIRNATYEGERLTLKLDKKYSEKQTAQKVEKIKELLQGIRVREERSNKKAQSRRRTRLYSAFLKGRGFVTEYAKEYGLGFSDEGGVFSAYFNRDHGTISSIKLNKTYGYKSPEALVKAAQFAKDQLDAITPDLLDLWEKNDKALMIEEGRVKA